jgi:ribosomal protein L7/L12
MRGRTAMGVYEELSATLDQTLGMLIREAHEVGRLEKEKADLDLERRRWEEAARKAADALEEMAPALKRAKEELGQAEVELNQRNTRANQVLIADLLVNVLSRKRIRTITLVRNLTGLNIRDAKNLVDQAMATVPQDY